MTMSDKQVVYSKPTLDKEKTLDQLRYVRDMTSYIIRMYDAGEIDDDTMMVEVGRLRNKVAVKFSLQEIRPTNGNNES